MSARSGPARLPTAAFATMRTTLLLLGHAVVAQAAPARPGPLPGRGHGPALERLDRGLVATVVPQGVFLSWRLLRSEATGATEAGLTGPDFRVYRDGTLVATVSGRSNHVDAEGTPASSYRVVPVIRGRERGQAGQTTPLAQPFLDIALQRPADGVTPAGEAYTYSAGDASVGDVDGDGAYEYLVKWNPSNAKDVSLRGYTGPVYLDTYETDGTLRHRIDLGVNIRAGEHYTQFMVYDFDGDGRQEIVYGSATIDDDGDLLYSSTGTRPDGTVAKLGHGDSMHVTDIDPARPGLEIYTVHENVTAPYGYVLRDAATGEAIYGQFAGRDVGRAMVGDVLPEHPGLETWSIGMRTAAGVDLGTRIPGTDQSIRWAGDMTTQIISRVATVPTISDWRRGVLLTASDTRTSNGIKNVSLVADVIGDWREEMVVGTADSSALRVYTTTEPSDHLLYTLMHDPQYRVEVARQNTTYNQPSYTSFYLGSDMDFGRVPLRQGRHR